MSAARHIAFNGDWHKECSRCKKPYGAHSLEGLRIFFYGDSSRPDGLSHLCKTCNSKKDANYGHAAIKRRRNPLSHLAQTKLNNAIASGKIVKKPCRDCGDTKVHGHHYDYSKPLDVIWLCQKHHSLEHKRIKNEAKYG